MTTSLTTHHWARLYGPALATGNIKSLPSDFKVEENLGFEPSGEGEHVAIFVEKTNINTAFLAEKLAQFSAVPLRDVSYAGRKDKNAVTQQWFTVNDKGANSINWEAFKTEGVVLKKVTRHHRKIKVGSHKGNRFSIIIRDFICNDTDELSKRIELITKYGFTNYFGQQRFGEMRKEGATHYNGNLLLAEKAMSGEKIKNRNKKNMVVSAMRSWLFNEITSQRIKQFGATTIIEGDVLLLSGSNSFFVCSENEVEEAKKRLSNKDIKLSAPMWGTGKLHSKNAARDFEGSIAGEYGNLTKYLEEALLQQQRRPIIAVPRDVDYQLKDTELSISFSLDKGCFATSMLREFMRLKHEEYNENIVE